MAVKVIDASALAALLFGEPEADDIVARLDGAELAAPALLSFEIANVCLVKVRRYPEQRDALISAFRLRNHLLIAETAVDSDDVLAVASATGLTAYDASYLWLARRLGAELITLDKRLANADLASQD